MTTAMKDRGITITVSILCAFGATLYGNKLAEKNSQTAKYEDRIKNVELNKLDKTDFSDHVRQQKEDREKDNAAVIQAINEQGKATREWIDISFKKNRP